ncbi:aldose epimerase family protein [Thalassotalea hakodatensis]|uniref:aldose epimerase family protein n=1 Tax=Thalassotalea hakodatensis TaxID=3030492 RepID=UPI00257337DF|nr:aldose epimerase family protein [Thalassotalea hakodatensis]
MTRITAYEIKNHQGDTLSITNFGARIIRWQTKVGDESRNIVLGYPDLEDYLTDPFFMGAIVGPYANRIANACYTVDEKEVTLSANEGKNQLHGGKGALDSQFWQCSYHDDSSLTLTCQLKDGFNGYPGNISIKVNYEISPTSELIINIEVNTAKATIVGPTAHPYFNLNAKQQSTEHNLQVNSSNYTPVNKHGIPLGEIQPVEGSHYDFSSPTTISKANNNQSLDDNFILSLQDTTIEKIALKHASLTSQDKKLTLQVSSNYPAIQVYAGKHLNKPFTPNQGICLEPQFCPDSPNQLAFPFHMTSPNGPLKTEIRYALIKAQ